MPDRILPNPRDYADGPKVVELTETDPPYTRNGLRSIELVRSRPNASNDDARVFFYLKTREFSEPRRLRLPTIVNKWQFVVARPRGRNSIISLMKAKSKTSDEYATFETDGWPIQAVLWLEWGSFRCRLTFSRSLRESGRETLNPAPYRRRPVFSLTPRLEGNNIEQSIICEIMPLFDNQTNGTEPNRTGDGCSRKAAEECSPQRKRWVRKPEPRSPGRGERTAMAARTQLYKCQNETVDPP
jgi:hypothetical protein